MAITTLSMGWRHTGHVGWCLVFSCAAHRRQQHLWMLQRGSERRSDSHHLADGQCSSAGHAAVLARMEIRHQHPSLAIPCQKTSKGAAWLRSNLLQDGNSFCALRAPAGVSPGSMQQPSRSRLVQADAAPLVLTAPVRPLRRCTRSTLLQGTPGLDNSAAP